MNDSSLQALQKALAETHAHADAAEVRAFAQQIVDWAVDHFATLPQQPIGQTSGRPEMEELLRQAPPEAAQGFEKALADFQNCVAPYAFRVNHPRFLAFIPSAPSFLSVLGDWLCASANFFAGVWLEAAGPTEVELIVLDWFKSFLGYPAAARGILTGGGSEANLTALVVAREAIPFGDRSRTVLYMGEQRHLSVDRAAKIIGLRPEQLHRVATDQEFRMQPAALREAIRRDRAEGRQPWVVVANAGATSTGTVDDLTAIADICAEERLWLHVDAAYGWPAVLIDEGKALLHDIGRADSITLDPHKWFGQTFEAGCVLVRDGKKLGDCFALRPDYMQDVEPADDEINFADHGIALTRRFRALKIWLSVKALGLGWNRELVRRCCQLAELGQVLLERSGPFEIVQPRQLSIVCFRYRPAREPRNADELDQLNLALVEELRKTGRAFLSSTRLRGRVALRFCFINWRTTSGDVAEVVRLLEECGARLTAGEKQRQPG